MTLIESGKLVNAITCIDDLRENCKIIGQPAEAELLYQVKQLVGELNQYFSGGYLSPDYIEEKCDSIKRRTLEIWETKFNK
jgi:hypothetical protein